MNGCPESSDSASPIAWLAEICARSNQGAAEVDSRGLGEAGVVFQALVDILPLNLLVKDAHGRRVFANRSYLTLHQTDWPAIQGKTDFDLFPEALARKYHEDDLEVLASGTVLRGVEELIAKDGRRQWIERVKGPLRDAQGRIVGVQLLFWDVTDRITAAEALDLERDLLKSLMDNIPDAIYFKDRESRFLRVSRAMADRFGLSSPEEVIGKTDADVFTAEHAGQALHDEQEIMRTGQPLVAQVEKETWADRADTWVSTTKMPLTNQAGQIAGTFGISRDITELKQTQDELVQARDAAEAASRAKSSFLANVSHEIRTPMNGIIGMTELLLNTKLTNEQREYQNIVKNSADALLGLLNDILDFSKIEAGKLELESIPFSLRETLARTVQTLANRASGKGLELALRIPPDVPDRFRGDPGRIRQIVVNLVGNAIKFTHEGEIVVEVAVETVREGMACLRMAVRDTGIGVPSDKQAAIFEAFSQVDASTTRQYGGTGLGLAISLHLVKLMDGRIWLDSEPGRGSTFQFTVQLEIDDAPLPPPTGLETLEQLPILVVDDNETNRFICQEMLSSWNMQPAAAESGSTALELLNRATDDGHPFRMMLLDMMMPEMDGYEVARRVRADEVFDDLTIIMLSSAGRSDDDQLSGKYNIARNLTKPITQSNLLNAITGALGGVGVSAAPTDTITGDRPADFAPRRILLAEDGLVNQRVAASLLEKRGHQVVIVNNGEQAVAAATSEPFDVVLMDVQMPVLDGFAATSEIRQRERQAGTRIPIIAMTAHAMKGDRQRCLDAGMDGYVAKPFRPRELFAAVEEVDLPAGGPAATSAIERAAAHAAAAVQAGSLPYNQQQALGNVGGSTELLREMALLFLQEGPKQMDEILAARASGSNDLLSRAAHALKGSVSMFAAHAAFGAALRIEEITRDGRLDEFDDAWEQLRQEIGRLMPALEHLVSRH